MKKFMLGCSTALMLMAASAPAMMAGDIEFVYKVPTDTKFIRGTKPGVKVYNKPSAKAPYLKFVEMGEGSYSQWSNKKIEYGSPETEWFDDKWITVAQGTSGAYTKIDVATEDGYDTGYVLTSKVQVVKPVPFTDAEIKEYTSIQSGTFAGFVVAVVPGEGVSCNIGRIEDGVIVYFKSMNIYYDENTKGVDVNEYGNLYYGPDCGGSEMSYYGNCPEFDISKLSSRELTKFFGLFQKHGFDIYQLLINTSEGLRDVYYTDHVKGREVTLRYPGE